MARKRNEYEAVFGSREQYCPQCRTPLEKRSGYFECPICYHSITDDEVDEFGGLPTLESTNEYEEYYPNTYDPYKDEDFEWHEL